MSWRAQSRYKDAKTPSVGRGMSEKPELGLWPIQPYGWIGQQPGSGFINRPREPLGVFASLDRF